MNVKILLAVFVVGVVIVGGILFLINRPSQVNVQPSPSPATVQPTDQPFEWISDITAGSGEGTPPPEGAQPQDGPWNHRVMSATSNDGLTWVKDNKILADQASVPDVMLDKEGNIRVYYVDWYNGGGLSVALSRDGVNWIYKKVGIPMGWVDPEVVLLPDGRYRLYASYMPSNGPQDKILSAISNYGISFVQEEGVRYQGTNGMVMDPTVIKMGDIWRMFLTDGSSFISTISSDGLSFTREQVLPFNGGIPCAIAVENGYRLYFSGGNIFCAFSADGKTWGSAVQVLTGGPPGSLDQKGIADPDVVRMPNGTYKMFYKTWIK
jgi:hypothetical protein